MRKYSAVLSIGLLLVLLGSVTAADPQTPLLLTHVTVIDVAGGPSRPDYTVAIAGGRITAMGPAAKIPAPPAAQVLDATGKFLIPGLWDMHVHWHDKDYLQLYIANGVTGVRVMAGSPSQLEWRKELESGQLQGPHLVLGSPIVDGPKPFWRQISVKNEAEARAAVIKLKQSGWDFVKVYQFLTRDAYFAIADEAKKQGIPFAGHVPLSVSPEEASRAGQKSFEHLIGILPACSTRRAELTAAAQADLAEDLAGWPKFWGPHLRELRQATLDSYSAAKAAALFSELKSNGTWQCPTLTLLHMFGFGDDPAFLKDARLKYMPRQIRAGWNPAAVDGKRTPEDFAFMKKEFQKDLEVVGAMQKAGVGILAGTDTMNPFCFPGFSLHDELGFLVQAGLSPMQALQAATLNPARFFGNEKNLGTVEPGKVADLVLLDANPLDDIGNTRRIAAVVSGGKLLTRAALDEMLTGIEAIANRKSIGEALAKTIRENGVDAAVKQYRELRATQPAAYDFGEDEFIDLGYRLIAMKKFKDAIEIFKLSVEAYPQSYNTYDSLAEAYMDDGDKELAIQNYQKSLEINPRNVNAVEKLKTLK
jgi:imidazolonepropionase-like amidohydrolase